MKKIIKIVMILIMMITMINPITAKVGYPDERPALNKANAIVMKDDVVYSNSLSKNQKVVTYKIKTTTACKIKFNLQGNMKNTYLLISCNTDTDRYNRAFLKKDANKYEDVFYVGVGEHYIQICPDPSITSNDVYGNFKFSVDIQSIKLSFPETHGVLPLLQPNKTYYGIQEFEGDQDYYSIVIPQSSKMTFTLKTDFEGQNFRIVSDDYNNDSAGIVAELNGKTKFERTETFYLRKGKYRLLTWPVHYLDHEQTGQYEFKYTLQPCKETFPESGESASSTNKNGYLSLSPTYQTIYGQIAEGGNDTYDVDMFTFKVEEPSLVQWKLYSEIKDCDMKIIDEKGTVYKYEVLNTSVNSRKDCRVYLDPNADGTPKVYYLRYTPTSNKASGCYRFTINKQIPFYDVDGSAWYYNTVRLVHKNNLMSGVAKGQFAPNDPMSRAMVAVVLHRMAGSKYVAYTPVFKDVKKGEWYTNAIMWASQNKVVNGYASGNFGVKDAITREQMAAMCYNYMKFKTGSYPIAKTSLTNFKDYKAVTKNMEKAMKWAVENKIITGTSDGYLKPTATATRAQCAKMLFVLYNLTK